ncbi:MAG: DivIVA domain-containing protein [Clostridia bacterium]|nr:DivIVA domain-containing protein [Clostridia bacterium]
MKGNNQRFKVRCSGYDKKQVESFIAELQSRHDAVAIEQRERISALKQQNDELSRQLAVLQGREEQIKLTLLKATKTADELDAQIKQRYKAELERLKLFRAKWMAAYDELKDRYHFEKDALNMESVAVQTELELTKYLTQEFSLTRGDDVDDMEAYFKQEVDRLTRLQQSMQEGAESKSKELKQKLRTKEKAQKDADIAEEGAFSLDEALHPTESLVDICKSLGIG